MFGGAALDLVAEHPEVELNTQQRDAMAHVGSVLGCAVNVTANYYGFRIMLLFISSGPDKSCAL